MKEKESFKKKIVCVAFLVVLVLEGIIGCGGSGSSSSYGSASPQGQGGTWDTMVWDRDNWQ